MATETENSVPLADSMKSGIDKPEKTLTPTPADGSQHTAETVSPAPTQENAASGGTEKAMTGGSSKQEAAQGAASGGSTESANDIEKKLRRAERFGLPLQLSEQEKRSSRAERFGNVSGGLDAPKSSEDLKRKARAERFGVVASSAVDEEERKKARLAKFGSSTKIDTQEEEKRKARALRFAQHADSPSHANGKGTIEMNASVTSNGVGGT